MIPKINIDEINIIIIGAGISGMTCAEHLKNRFKNIQIMEASERIGGRLFTYGKKKVSSGEGWNYLEMGSQRVGLGTCMYKVAEELNQIIADSPDYFEAVEKLYMPAYGRTGISAINNLRWSFNSKTLMPENLDELNILEDDNIVKEKEVYEKKGEKLFSKCVDNYMHGTYAWWYGLAYAYSFERIQKELLHGYNELVQSILKTLPPNTVIPNKEVIEIDWSDFKNEISKKYRSQKIRILCRDKSVYEADHVIIAIPFGYLKENHQTLFIPSLPEYKISAIENLNFITVNKIFFEFETRFWAPTQVFHIIWNEKMNKLFDVQKHKNGKSPVEWIKCINRFEYVFTSNNTLCAWIWGEGAKIVETLPEEEIAESCMILLEHLTMKKKLPRPKSVIRSRWHSNPLFRGSVVYDPSRFIHNTCKKVSETIFKEIELIEKKKLVCNVVQASASRVVTCKLQRPVLQFTGDVGSSIVSSVEGAIHGGVRAATELMHYYHLRNTI